MTCRKSKMAFHITEIQGLLFNHTRSRQVDSSMISQEPFLCSVRTLSYESHSHNKLLGRHKQSRRNLLFALLSRKWSRRSSDH